MRIWKKQEEPFRLLFAMAMMLVIVLSACQSGGSHATTQPDAGDPTEVSSETKESHNQQITPKNPDKPYAEFEKKLRERPIYQLTCLDPETYIEKICYAGGTCIAVEYGAYVPSDRSDHMIYKKFLTLIDIEKDEVILKEEISHNDYLFGVRKNGEIVVQNYSNCTYKLYSPEFELINTYDSRDGDCRFDYDSDCMYYIHRNVIEQDCFDGMARVIYEAEPRVEILDYDPGRQLAVIRANGINERFEWEYSVISIEDESILWTKADAYLQYQFVGDVLYEQADREDEIKEDNDHPFSTMVALLDIAAGTVYRNYTVSYEAQYECMSGSPYVLETCYTWDYDWEGDPEEADEQDDLRNTDQENDTENGDFIETVPEEYVYEENDSEENASEEDDSEYDFESDPGEDAFYEMEHVSCRFLDLWNGKAAELFSEFSGAGYVTEAYLEPLHCCVLGMNGENDYQGLYLIAPSGLNYTEELEAYVPEEVESEECTLSEQFLEERIAADELEQKYGIRILLGDECLNAAPNDYYSIISTEDSSYIDAWTEVDSEIDRAIEVLDRALGAYPEGFFETFCNYRGVGGLRILLVRELVNNDGEFMAGGLQYRSGAWYNVVIDIDGLYATDVVHHELWHAVEQRITDEDYSAFSWEEWNELNPDDFGYQEDFDHYYDSIDDLEEYILPWDDEERDVYFIEIYSTVTPYEDRATIIAKLLSEYYDADYYGYPSMSEYLNSFPHLKSKLEYMGEQVEQVFGCVYWEEMLE